MRPVQPVTVAVRPSGTWPSPLTPERLVAGATAPGEVRVDGGDIWWSESRPDEGGRVALVRRRVDGTTVDVLAGRGTVLPGGGGDVPDRGAGGPGDGPAPRWSARTGLYEYGGGAWCVEAGAVTFAQADDQRLYRLVADDPDAVPVPLTPAPVAARGVRYGDLVALSAEWVLAVRETHPGEPHPAWGPGDRDPQVPTEPVHEIVAVPTDGSAGDDPGRVRVLVAGPDFVSSPRPGPGRLAWTQWSHPRMPWDGTELCVAPFGLDADRAPVLRGAPVVVAGGPEESVVQPEWDGEGALWFCSDRSGWWNLHRVDDPGGAGPPSGPQPVAPVAAEIGGARWVGGMCWYAPLGDGRVVAAATASGTTDLVLVDPASGGPPVSLGVTLAGAPVSVVSQVVAGPGPSQVAVVAASPRAEPTPLLVALAPPARRAGPDGRVRLAVPVPPGSEGADGVALRPARDVGLAPGDVAVPEAISFPSAGGRTAHALLYRPASSRCVGPEGERPPLVVMIHGGPTSAARPQLDLRTQFWTTRGFAVVDVDHGGSTGYGRPYRRLLDRAWGVVDVEDCVAAARHLAATGVVDGERMVIRGGSAGGFTALLALLSGAFAAGTSLYGVTDLAALARDTHKFEARYTDGLVGPWPEAADLYAARSPLAHLDRLATPVLVLQGAEDQVVPPAQAEAVVAALAARGIAHRYVLFAGEGHGFRRSETLVRALEAELAFYTEVLGLEQPP